jgi:glycosyltransferase involved in cell wall biosynthesis
MMKRRKMISLRKLFELRNIAIVHKVFVFLPGNIQRIIRNYLLTNNSIQKSRKKKLEITFKILRNPKVSIVLPNYNHVEYLRFAIEGVLNQDYANTELIVVDDGSTDLSKEIISEYRTNSRVKIILNDHAGLWATLNSGFEQATGDLLTWTSADNLMDQTATRFLVESFQQLPHAGMVYSDYAIIDEIGNPIFNSFYRKYDQVKGNSAVIHNCRMQSLADRLPDNFVGPYFMYRREVAQKIGQYKNLEGFEDYDYWLRISNQFQISHVHSNAIHYEYRIHRNTLSFRANELKTHSRLLTYLEHEEWKK